MTVERFEVAVTFKFVPKIDEAFRVVVLVLARLDADVMFRELPKIEVPLRVVTLVLERLEVPVTFRELPKNEAPLRVVTLVVERLEVPVTFSAPPKIVEVFVVEETFIVVTDINGIVKVSKLNTVFVELEVNPAANMFVVNNVLVTFAL